MNKLRFIALALCAVMTFGLICGCNDTKPAGTVSDGASQTGHDNSSSDNSSSDNSSSDTVSEDPIFTKTGKLTDEEIKIIAADRIGKYNDFLDFISNECFDNYTDKTEKLPISSPEYYKIIDDGKYNISTYEGFRNYVYTFLCSVYEEDKLLSFDTAIYVEINGEKICTYSGNDKDKILTAFDERTDTYNMCRDMYIRKSEPRTEKYVVNECVPVDSGEDYFIVDVPVYTADGKDLIRHDSFVFLSCRSGYLLYLIVSGNFDDFPELSDSEAQKIADSLGTAYTNAFNYLYSSGLCSSDSETTIPFSDRSYQRMGIDKKTGLNSSNIIPFLLETYVDPDNNLDVDYYHGTLPLEFVINGRKFYTAHHDILQNTYVEYNGELYCGVTCLDCFPRAENIKILLRGRNFMEIAVPTYETTGELSGSSHLWIVRTNGKYKILCS